MLTVMKATIDIPDDLYRKVSAKSAAQGRPVDAVTAELFQRWIDEEADSPTEPVAQVDAAWPENWFRLADEIFKQAPPGPSTREILEQDRGRIEDWLRMGEEASRNAPPGPTATEILDDDRNRLERR